MNVLYQEWHLDGRPKIASISRDMDQLRASIRMTEAGKGRNGPLGLPKEAWIHNSCPLAVNVRKATAFLTDEDLPMINFKRR